MAKTIKFTKMHGAGNDYIYVDTMQYPITNPAKVSVEWSAYHTGIGSDGLVLIGKSPKADFSMRIFNADGSEAMMCGNASRCIGKYLYEHGLTIKKEIMLDTLSGIRLLKLHVNAGSVSTVTVDMGKPTEIGTVYFGNDFPFISTQVSIGNPHLVTFIDDITTIDLPKLGPQLENYSLFPDRTNVEFAQIISPDAIRMRVWERGSGITQACGTGSCATVVAAVINKKAGRKCNIIMDGGTVETEWNEETGHVFMTGPAIQVYEGTIELEE